MDHRERGSRVVEELAGMKAPLKFEALDVGDYVIGREIGIERKTCSDFLSSIADKRLFEQVNYLRQAFARPILVVEGDFNEVLRYRGFKDYHVYGAMAALLEMEVQVVRTVEPRETAGLIFYLYKRAISRRDKRYVAPAKLRVLRKNRGVDVVQLNMVSSIPGISGELAHRMLEHFKTPRRLFNASLAELLKVKGLGYERARRIIEVLDTAYPSLLGEGEGE